jgi:2-C-methyl-D-erythritol 4-phosphate cytidylyltransferase
MLVHAVHALAASRSVQVIVIAAPADLVEDVRSLLGQVDSAADITVVTGGETRQESVARALIAVPDDVDVVLVHDAARPLVPPEVVSAVTTAVRSGAPAVVPGIPLADTIKAVDGDGIVTSTPDRSALRAIQTPQGFRRSVLQAAHAAVEPGQPSATDDAGLVEQAGIPVMVIPGHEEAFKVTRPIDLILAEAILARRRSASGR